MPLPLFELDFAPAWWRANYGIESGAAVWRDPIARTERDLRQRRLLFERFGDVGLGEEHPQPRPNIEAYGHRFMAALWGCRIVYLPDQDPAAEVLPDARQRLERLSAPDLDTSPVARQALAEAEQLRQCFGTCAGGVNFGSPLNNAVTVFGEEILSACLLEPDLARRVLMTMAETILAVYDRICCRIDGVPVTEPRPAGGIGNCQVCMLSPRTYAEVVFPADLWLRNHFTEFGLHHCGLFHPYAAVYHPLRLKEIDVGWGTDLRATRQVFPETSMCLQVQAVALAGRSRSEIDALLRRLIRDAAPAARIRRIWVAEAGTEVSDATVRDLLTAPQRLFPDAAAAFHAPGSRAARPPADTTTANP